ncbi:PadR family transcriptional regulator [Alkalicoccus daliensis]|uniref:Transcriptional regulator PadR-like family protein n=1 Tax=Alkalicoccus daliensis TaxID=745820 RepID=A0A1H0JMP5_9BACI|nr:PadR family transcriptional regulator [Alkalicoccus daliensis]SDO45058.1 Transcriptional regulator PadR-like family protein [Alkalicoccus daliensis]
MARNESLKQGELTDTMYYILITLLQPMHGYAIMQAIEKMTNGTLKIGPASMYTTLKKLKTKELIVEKLEENNKKVYLISNYGKTVLQKEVVRREMMVQHGKIALEGNINEEKME